MATKKFIIEVEEGISYYETCPCKTCDGLCHNRFNIDCTKHDLATMKITELPSLEYTSDNYIPMDIRLTPRDLTFKY